MNRADSLTTIPFDLCKPRNRETGLAVFSLTISTGTSISGPRKLNIRHKAIYMMFKYWLNVRVAVIREMKVCVVNVRAYVDNMKMIKRGGASTRAWTNCNQRRKMFCPRMCEQCMNVRVVKATSTKGDVTKYLVYLGSNPGTSIACACLTFINAYIAIVRR